MALNAWQQKLLAYAYPGEIFVLRMHTASHKPTPAAEQPTRHHHDGLCPATWPLVTGSLTTGYCLLACAADL